MMRATAGPTPRSHGLGKANPKNGNCKYDQGARSRGPPGLRVSCSTLGRPPLSTRRHHINVATSMRFMFGLIVPDAMPSFLAWHAGRHEHVPCPTSPLLPSIPCPLAAVDGIFLALCSALATSPSPSGIACNVHSFRQSRLRHRPPQCRVGTSGRYIRGPSAQSHIRGRHRHTPCDAAAKTAQDPQRRKPGKPTDLLQPALACSSQRAIHHAQSRPKSLTNPLAMPNERLV